jgi:hypothetical protein
LTVRQTALNVAATFAAAKPELTSADMLKLAEPLESWMLRRHNDE